MTNRVAINPKTGAVLVEDDNGNWVAPEVARNRQTGELIYRLGDGEWKPVPPSPVDGGAERWLGLGLRSAAQGVATVPGLAIDAARWAVGKATGNEDPWPKTDELVDRAADYLGLPRPETSGERIFDATVRNVASLPASFGVGGVLAKGAAPLAQRIGRALLAAPGTQAFAAATGGAAQGIAAEHGAGPIGQTVANFAGGLAGAGALSAGRGAARWVQGAIEPFREAGRKRIVAELLLRGTDDPATLGQRITDSLDDATRRLPGATPTTAQAARDPGLLVMEHGLRSDPELGAMIRSAEMARNQARLDTIDDLARTGTAADFGARVRTGLAGAVDPDTRQVVSPGARQVMQSRTSQLYEAIDPEGVLQINPQKAIDTFDAVASNRFSVAVTPELRRITDEMRNLGRPLTWDETNEVMKSLGEIAGRAAASGDRATASLAGRMRSALEGSLDELGSEAAQAARAQAREVGGLLGRDPTGTNAIGRVLGRDRFGAPMVPDEKAADAIISSPSGVRQFLAVRDKALRDAAAAGVDDATKAAVQANLDNALEGLRGQFIDRWRQNATTTAPSLDATGEIVDTLSAPKALSWWNKNKETARLLFSPDEFKRLEQLAADFTESNLAVIANARGSPTAQNLAVQNLISRTTGGFVNPQSPGGSLLLGLGGVVPRVLHRSAEEKLRRELAAALLDPHHARGLISQLDPAAIAQAGRFRQDGAVQKLIADALIRQGARTTVGTMSSVNRGE
jgi:hypothetical protein